MVKWATESLEKEAINHVTLTQHDSQLFCMFLYEEWKK